MNEYSGLSAGMGQGAMGWKAETVQTIGRFAAVEEKAEPSNANGRKCRAVQKERRLAAGSLLAQTGRSSPTNSALEEADCSARMGRKGEDGVKYSGEAAVEKSAGRLSAKPSLMGGLSSFHKASLLQEPCRQAAAKKAGFAS